MEEYGFLPGFKSLDNFAESYLLALSSSTKASNRLPNPEEDYNDGGIYRQTMRMSSNRILNLIQSILRYHGIGSNLISGDEPFDSLIDANVELLDRAATLLDEAAGIKKNDNFLVLLSKTPKPLLTSGMNMSKNMTLKSGAIKNSGYNLIASRIQTKPQISFEDKVDNSNLPFYPKITEKPNALKSLDESLKVMLSLDYETDPNFHFPHPYQFELDNFIPDEKQFDRVVAKVPQSLESTRLTLIDNVSQVKELIEKLNAETEIAIDLEHHSFRSFQGFTCLMQISTRNEDFIIDTLFLRHELQQLNIVFTNPKIVKVLHGADMDIHWLQKDFGLYIVNLFDTGQASRLLAFPHYSLAFLLKHYCNIEADKQYQRADWRIRPLPQELINYAREDTHHLLYIYDCMKNDLLYRDNNQMTLINACIQNSKHIAMKKYEKPRLTDETHQVIYQQELNRRHHEGPMRKNTTLSVKLNVQQMAALKSICAWRDSIARQEDESTGYVLPTHMMLQICEILPREPQGIIAICSPFLPPLVRVHVDEIHRLIQTSRNIRLTQIEKSPNKRPEQKRDVGIKSNVSALNLFNCPHDLSEADCVTSGDSLILESNEESPFNICDQRETSNLLMQKKEPIMSAFKQLTERKKKKMMKKVDVNRVSSFFDDPFLRFLPTKLLQNHESVNKTQMIWNLVPQTVQPNVDIQVKPVLEVVKTAPELALENSDDLRQQVNLQKKKKRKHETTSEEETREKRKEKKRGNDEEITTNSDDEFKPHVYKNLDISKFLEEAKTNSMTLSKSKSKKDFDPNLKLSEPDYKAPARPRLFHGQNNKTVIYNSKNSPGTSSAKIQWPRK